MRVVITGGTGFLGKHIQEAFKAYPEHQVYFLGSRDCDCLDNQQVSLMLLSYKPDVVIHAAALCGGIKINSKRPADFISANLQMGINIFEASKDAKINKVYTLGSVCAYPVHCPVPFKEDDIWEGFPEVTNSPYGVAKRALMVMGNAYRQQYGIGGAHLIPVNMYGEYDHFDLQNSHVIPALINKFTTAVKEGKLRVECWGTGSATREFLYAGDAAQAILKTVLSDLDTELPINIGTGREISIKDLAYLIAHLTEFTGEIVFTGEVSDGQPRRQLDVTRAKELLGFVASTDLEQGLRKTIKWYLEQR